jgi:PAS domain S-box-containing protein
MSPAAPQKPEIIACTPLAFLIAQCRSCGIDPKQIAEDTEMPLSVLGDPKEQTTWSIFHQCMENAGRIWQEPDLVALGAKALDSPAYRTLKTVMRLTDSPRELYHGHFMPGGGLHQDSTLFDIRWITSASDGLVLEWTMNNGHPFSRPYARFLEGMLAAYPTVLGLPPAKVVAHLEAASARYEIRFPRESGFLGRFRRRVARLRALYGALMALPEIQALLQTRFKEVNAQRRLCEKVQSALRLSEERYRTLVEYSPDAIVVVDMDSGYFTDANGNAEELFGLDRTTLLTKGPDEVSAPVQAGGRDSKPLAREYLQAAFEGRHPVFEWIHRNGQGEDIVCEVRLARLPDSGRRLVRASVTDIRRRKAAEAELRRLATAIAAAGEAIIITDPNGIIQYVNPAFETQTGFSQAEALGKTPAILKSGYQEDDFYRTMWGAITRGEVWRGVLFNRRKNGDTYDAELTIAPVFDDSGALMNFTAVSRDISRRKRAEETVAEQQMKMIASSRLATLGVMSASIAHEIKNPLAVICGYAEQLAAIQRRDYPDRADCALIVDSIARNALRIGRIVDGLRSLAREGAQDPFTICRVKSIVGETLELCRARFLPGRIGLFVEEMDDHLDIECRRSQMAQVLLNLLANALDAVRDLPEPWVRIEVHETGDDVEISVTDSGAGLPENIRKRIFDEFFTTKTVEEGMGLGLSISRAIVEAHKGNLSVDTACPNTRFIVRLPRRQPKIRHRDDSHDPD